MRWRTFLLLLVVVWTPQAPADTFISSEDKAPFCKKLLGRLNAGEKPVDAVRHIGAASPEFTPARITFQVAANAPKVTEAIYYASFDVDNDGIDEVLIKYLTSLRGKYGELLWIVRHGTKELDFASVPLFSPEEYSRLEAIESTTPWPYESRGLFFVEIAPIKLHGVNYFSIQDTLFLNSAFPDRSWIIAKFSGRKLGPGGFGHETDDFQTICSFRRRQ